MLKYTSIFNFLYFFKAYQKLMSIISPLFFHSLKNTEFSQKFVWLKSYLELRNL